MTRLPRTIALALALAASLLLAGCGSGSTTLSLDDVTPVTGQTVAGTGYSFVVPESWNIAEESVQVMGFDTFVTSSYQENDYVANVNVALASFVEKSLDELEKHVVAEFEKSSLPDIEIEDVTIRDRVMVAGSAVAHISSTSAMRDVKLDSEQFYLLNSDGLSAIMTFSFVGETTAAQRDALCYSILVTWSWN